MNGYLIVSDPEILNGKPIVRGTRISVALILQCIASGMKSYLSLWMSCTICWLTWREI